MTAPLDPMAEAVRDTTGLRERLADAYVLRESSNPTVAKLAELCRDAHDVLAALARPSDTRRVAVTEADAKLLRDLASFAQNHHAHDNEVDDIDNLADRIGAAINAGAGQ